MVPVVDAARAEQLFADGFVVIPDALSGAELVRTRDALDASLDSSDFVARDGYAIYDGLLDQDQAPDEARVCRGLIRHPSVDGLLTRILGSGYAFYIMRAHNTPTTYSQPWRCDSAQWSRYYSQPIGDRGVPPAIQAHTTFYLDTLTPETGYLKMPYHNEFARQFQQISAQPMERNASWMSLRRSYRVRSRRLWCNQASVLSTTQRKMPSPLPCGVRRVARCGSMPRERSSCRCGSESYPRSA